MPSSLPSHLADSVPQMLWLYDKMILKLCAKEYSLDHLTDRFRHLTNCAVQKEFTATCAVPNEQGCLVAGAPTAAPAACGGDDLCDDQLRDEQLWSSHRFSSYLQEHGHGDRAWEDRVLPAIEAVAVGIVASAQRQANGRGRREASFEILGLDVRCMSRTHALCLRARAPSTTFRLGLRTMHARELVVLVHVAPCMHASLWCSCMSPSLTSAADSSDFRSFWTTRCARGSSR